MRLSILNILAGEAGYRCNSAVLGRLLDGLGYRRSRDNIHYHLRELEQAGALAIFDEAVSGVLIATLKRRGLDHVEGRVVIDGVQPPEPDA